jgi:hypothetical protein
VSSVSLKLKTSDTQNNSTFVDSFVVEKVDINKKGKGGKKKRIVVKGKKEKTKKKSMSFQWRRLKEKI